MRTKLMSFAMGLAKVRSAIIPVAVLVLSILAIGVFPASAAELTRWEIYNKVYEGAAGFTPLISNVELASFLVTPDEVWPLVTDTISLGATARARYAGYNHEFGFYTPTGQTGPPTASERTVLFDIDRADVGQNVLWLDDLTAPSVLIPETGPLDFQLGFYLRSTADWDASIDHFLYSESAFNPLNEIPNEKFPVPVFGGGNSSTRDHMLTYTGQQDDLLIFWEDLIAPETTTSEFSTLSTWGRRKSFHWYRHKDDDDHSDVNPIDWDYNDFVVQIKPDFAGNTAAIPEPGTMALLAGGLIALGRRVTRNKKAVDRS